MKFLPILALATVASSQLLQPQTNTWNSTFSLSPKQVSSANLPDFAVNNINIAIRHEQTNWATGSVFSDPFYTDLPSNASQAPAGSVLKVEEFTNTNVFTIAPTLALSRIIYHSKTFNGSLVPVSAYILWPYYPRGGGSVAPLISWGHGTAGLYPECAPSHNRYLQYQFSGPLSLALAGYAVVASDYAGLGVPLTEDGTPIMHEYMAQPASGNDLLYAAQAAYAAFPGRLTRDFVVMGHSQGGGAAWAAAQQQLNAQIPGYLGTIAISPVTNVVEVAKALGNSLGLLQVARVINKIYPNVSVSDILTFRGVAAMNLLEEIQGCSGALYNLVVGMIGADPLSPLVHDKFLNSKAGSDFSNLVAAGGKDFQGPLLVIQGTDDENTPESVTKKYVEKTCNMFPKRELHSIKVQGAKHISTIYASQQKWLDWLDRRFSKMSKRRDNNNADKGKPNCHESGGGAKCKSMCTFENLGETAPRPLAQYQGEVNYYLSYGQAPYQVTL